MLGSEIKSFCESLIDDTIDNDLFYNLLDAAKNTIEDEVEWEILKSWDRSLTYSPGESYLTGKSLPATFRSMYGDGVIYLGEDSPYFPVPFKDLYTYRDSGNKYAIDYLNNKLHILGSESQSYTINLPFLVLTDIITATTSWSFPERFHKLLAFIVAGFYTAGVDADDIYARMSVEHKNTAFAIRHSMTTWNTRLALMAMGNSVAPYSGEINRDGHIDINQD